MSSELILELRLIGAAAADVGALAWAEVFVRSAGLAFVDRVLRGSRTVLVSTLVLILVGGVSTAHAQVSDEEVGQRLHFIEARLHGEATQAHAWESGWSIVYVAGLGFGAYQIAERETTADLTEGIVGITKSVIGAAGLALAPLKSGRGTSELREVPGGTVEERLQRLVLAESILRRNAHESDIRYSWKPHVASLVLNLAGGIAIWIAGDLAAAAQSTAIAIAVGELNIWTRPWKAKRDLREYQRQFGAMSGGAPAPANKTASLRFSGSGLLLTF